MAIPGGRFSRVLGAALVLLAASETLLLHWLLLASGGGPGLSPLAALATTPALVGLNLLLLVSLRRVPFDRRSVRVSFRAFLLISLGALFSGPFLALALLGARGASWIAGSGPDRSDTGFLAAGGLALTFGFGTILWGYLIGQRRVRVDRVDLPIRDLPATLAGLRVVQISDLHIGRQLRAPRLRKLIQRVNALEPDLLLISGDIFDFHPEYIEEGCLELAKLTARVGVYAVLGNHDVYTGADLVADGLRELTSIRLLRDEWTTLELGSDRLHLLGIDDPGRGWMELDAESPALERIALEAPTDAPRILLVHRPSFFRQAARLGIAAVLAGHTHGGQISLPPPAHHHNISRLIARWTRGLFEQDGCVLYVNRGLGIVGPPVRLNCPREIALLRLVPADG